MSEEALLAVELLRKAFRVRSKVGPAQDHVAVHDVSFEVMRGQSLAIVGESGSGKSTTARMIVGLETPTAGKITLGGRTRTQPARRASERRLRAREAQIVFQEPYLSLDPRQRVRDAVAEVLQLHFDLTRSERQKRIESLLNDVGLTTDNADAYPGELSGGQRQRVAIARALAVEPQLLVLDEPVSALDVSIQAQILNLFADLQDATSISYILISHDLAVVRQITHDAIVMKEGRVVERGPTDQILDSPRNSYTQLLRASVPGPGWKPQRNTGLLHDAMDRAL